MNQKAIKNVLTPVDGGDAATKGCVDSKSVGESDLNMNGNLIKNVRWPEEDHDSVNRAYVYFVAGKTLNRKVLNEISVNNLLESQKYLRLDGQNQMVSDLQMNDHKIVRLADATAPADV